MGIAGRNDLIAHLGQKGQPQIGQAEIRMGVAPMAAGVAFQRNPPQLRFLRDLTNPSRIHDCLGRRHFHGIGMPDLIEQPALHRLQHAVQIAVNNGLMLVFLP